MDEKDHRPILEDVARYYSGKLAEHGPTPRGVDWNGEASQNLRFEQLLRIVNAATPADFSLLDYGCGFGSMLAPVRARSASARFTGIDVSESMVAKARSLHADPLASFAADVSPGNTFDFVVASGIFNVRMQHTEAAWEEYILSTIDRFDALSRRGFAFNCLTSYSDAEHMKGYLHYADPCALFDRCKRKYSRHVALLHDYGLYEFTVLVRKVV